MIVYSARHCESEYNVQKLLNSDPSIKVQLTPKGILQAEKLAESLKNIEFDTIFVSELYRTQQTAEIVNEYHKMRLTIDPRLNDNKSGFEGRPITEYLNAIKSSNDGFRARFDDGESLEEVQNRVKEFVNELKETPRVKCLIITSGYIIECLYSISAKVSPELASSFDIPQGEYTTLVL